MNGWIPNDSIPENVFGYGIDFKNLPSDFRSINNLHFSGTFFLALKIFHNYVIAQTIASADMKVDLLFDGVKWILKKIYILPLGEQDAVEHHMAGTDAARDNVRAKSLEHYQNLLKNACRSVKNDAPAQADTYIGQALHTLQDSYSHSTVDGKPILPSEHTNGIDSMSTDPEKAGCALEESERVLIKFQSERKQGGAKIAIDDSCCKQCSFWEEQVLFGMKYPISEHKRACIIF